MSNVYVGLSGGVDSAVSAALLQQAGHTVTGVFIKTWQPDFIECTWRDEREDAMRVAAHLGIDFKTLDLTLEYKRDVADYMIAEYTAGRTPNPDVMCNKYVKFGGFYEWAREHGADFVATGHYAQVRGGRMYMGADNVKDQTYFLWTLTSDILEHTLFPVGELEKSQVRKLAHDFDLPVADKKDSQGVCFLGKIDMRDFLKNYIDEQQGDVLNGAGSVVGHHEGALFYTLGQRTGFTMTAKTPNDEPQFIVAKDIIANTITVVPESEYRGEDLPTNFEVTEVVLSDVSWIVEPKTDQVYLARFRYRGELHESKLYKVDATNWKIIFSEPQRSVAAGQSVVVYDGTECIGGGIIA